MHRFTPRLQHRHTTSISLLMYFYNSSFSRSTNLVMLCFDMVGHQSSHFLMNFTGLGWVPICKSKFSTTHKSARFATQRFFLALPCTHSSTHSSNVLCPCHRVSTLGNLAFLSSKSSQSTLRFARASSKSFGSCKQHRFYTFFTHPDHDRQLVVLSSHQTL